MRVVGLKKWRRDEKKTIHRQQTPGTTTVMNRTDTQSAALQLQAKLLFLAVIIFSTWFNTEADEDT